MQNLFTILQNMEMSNVRILAMGNREIKRQIEGFCSELFVLRSFYLCEEVLATM